MANVPAETGQTNAPSAPEGQERSGGGQDYEPSSNLLFGFNRLSVVRQIGLMVGLAASVALGVALVLWAQDPSYKPLLGDMSRFEPDQVMNILDNAGIDYRMEPRSGALLVASQDLYQARLRLAREGVTEDEGMGFEIIMQDQGLGTSQFMEKARFHRSLEGELSRTISAMGAVRNSRVHLAIPEDSVFVSDNRNPSASVMVDIGSGNSLNEGQVQSVVNLVAGSVPQMKRGDVTVVDQRGNHLSSNGGNEEAKSMARHFDIQRRVEQHLQQRVSGILAPIMGRERFNAEVSVDMDFSAVERAEEIFNPNQKALRSEETVEEVDGEGAAGGIPGALSNQPPGQAEAPEQAGDDAEQGNGEGGGGGSRSSRKSATRNYELNRLLSFTREEPGSVNRVSVAVAVDDLRRADPQTGTTNYVEWPEQELQRMTQLIRDAVGFSAARGDSVTVVNTPFTKSEEPKFEPPPFYQQPWFQDSIRPVLAGIVILALAIFLVRPTLKSLASTGQSERDLGGEGDDLGELGGLDEVEGGDSIRSAMSGGEDMLLPDGGEGYDRELNAVKGMIAEEPARVAQVMRQWVNADE
mgnify:CR=1 FL=1